MTSSSNKHSTESDARDSKSYEVGYKKPPIAHQFKKGQSGNPPGRRKKVKTIHETVIDELTCTRSVVVDGKRVQLPTMTLLVRSMLKAAFNFDQRATSSLLKLFQTAELDRKARDDGFGALPCDFSWSEEEDKLHAIVHQAAVRLSRSTEDETHNAQQNTLDEGQSANEK